MSPIVVFCGPSVSADEVTATINADVRPPAGQGDIYLAARERPWAIALIDGVFDQRLAVAHKEILWALSRGIRVYGAASMGALRAAELHRFGMEGIGTIFEAYQSGELTGDDEVAVIHGPSDAGYMVMTVAMVDVRATMTAAIAAEVLSATDAEAVTGRARDIFYFERTWSEIFAQASGVIGEAAASRLASFVETAAVPQKREDARALLRHLADLKPYDSAPLPVDWRFEPTSAWQEIVRRAEARAPLQVDDPALARILEEARVCADAERLVGRAWVRCLASATRDPREPNDDEVAEASARFRRPKGLFEPEHFMTFLRAQRIHDSQGYFEDQARTDHIRRRYSGRLDPALLAEVQAEALYPRMAERAARKWSCLVRRGLEAPRLEDVDLPEPALLGWFFHRLGHRRVPSDLAGFSRSLGFKSERAFVEALRRERCFVVAEAA